MICILSLNLPATAPVTSTSASRRALQRRLLAASMLTSNRPPSVANCMREVVTGAPAATNRSAERTRPRTRTSRQSSAPVIKSRKTPGNGLRPITVANQLHAVRNHDRPVAASRYALSPGRDRPAENCRRPPQRPLCSRPPQTGVSPRRGNRPRCLELRPVSEWLACSLLRALTAASVRQLGMRPWQSPAPRPATRQALTAPRAAHLR